LENIEIKPVTNWPNGRAEVLDIFRNWKLWWLGVAIAILSIVALLYGVFLSRRYGDWGFAGRFGAIVVILGTYLMARPVWRTRYKSKYASAILLSGNELMPEQIAEFMMDRVDTWLFFVGFALASIGSIVWGFADLLNCFGSWTGACAIPTAHR
jgi:uncharacterized membrane protein YfcA